MDRPNTFLTTPVAILLGSFVIGISILVSGGVIKFGSPSTAPAAAQPQAAQPQPAPAAPTSAKISLDDDPVLGDKNAKVTLIEFSDYECPFCKRHFTDVYPQIKKDYIDTGKVKLVYRDLIVRPEHNPMATTEAMAADCAREQGGDTAYFKIHDAMYTKTTSNGNGLTKDQVYQMATDIGLNANNLKSCVESAKYNEEVQKDIADGLSVGANGTPSFFVGKSDPSGTITGTIIVGAQPYSAFQQVIDPLLK